MISGLTGAGGGTVLIPLLAKMTTMPQQMINGTQHAAVAFSVLLATYHHIDAGTCNLPLALMTTVPSIACARLGVHAAHRVSSKRLSLMVGLAMLASAPLVLLKKSPSSPKFTGSVDPLDVQVYTSPSRVEDKHTFVARALADVPSFMTVNARYVAAGGIAGFIAGLCGTGGGILMTAYLTTAIDIPQETIIGTSLAAILPTASSAAYFNYRSKSLHVPTALRIGGALGAALFLTSKYVTPEMPEGVLRGMLATTIAASATVMMRKGLK